MSKLVLDFWLTWKWDLKEVADWFFFCRRRCRTAALQQSASLLHWAL